MEDELHAGCMSVPGDLVGVEFAAGQMSGGSLEEYWFASGSGGEPFGAHLLHFGHGEAEYCGQLVVGDFKPAGDVKTVGQV
jgi:hypothetical protein